jgi:hypothetical protein
MDIVGVLAPGNKDLFDAAENRMKNVQAHVRNVEWARVDHHFQSCIDYRQKVDFDKRGSL